MKKLIYRIFPSLKPKYFIVHGIVSSPYGESIYPFIFDVCHDKKRAEKMVEKWMNSNMKRSFWVCHDAEFKGEVKKYSFKEVDKNSNFMMGSHSCERKFSNLRYFKDHFSGPLDV